LIYVGFLGKVACRFSAWGNGKGDDMETVFFILWMIVPNSGVVNPPHYPVRTFTTFDTCAKASNEYSNKSETAYCTVHGGFNTETMSFTSWLFYLGPGYLMGDGKGMPMDGFKTLSECNISASRLEKSERTIKVVCLPLGVNPKEGKQQYEGKTR
jgi:hypothetical protein